MCFYSINFHPNLEYNEKVEKIRDRVMGNTPHWALLLIGVRELWKQKGVGSTLIKPILKVNDTERTPTFVATKNPKAVQFFKKNGFELVAEDDCKLGLNP
jgi:N-acetylglutamate synthase-like GNAT family acetyltransferase